MRAKISSESHCVKVVKLSREHPSGMRSWSVPMQMKHKPPRRGQEPHPAPGWLCSVPHSPFLQATHRHFRTSCGKLTPVPLPCQDQWQPPPPDARLCHRITDTSLRATPPHAIPRCSNLTQRHTVRCNMLLRSPYLTACSFLANSPHRRLQTAIIPHM